MNRAGPLLTPLPQAEPGSDFIDIDRLLHAVLRYKWGILGLVFVVTLATALYVSSLQPVYRASASVELKTQDGNAMRMEDARWNYRDYDYYQTQFEIMKSRSIAERVVRRLDLQDNPYFAGPAEKAGSDDDGVLKRFFGDFSLRTLLPAREQEPPEQLSPEQEKARAIAATTAAVAGGVQVEPVEYSYLAHLSFEATDPKLAARIVNTVAEEFIAADLEERTAGTVQSTEWLDERLSYLRDQLRSSEEALQDFREREGLVSIEGETSPGSNELSMLSQRLEDARRARIEAQNIKEDVQNMHDPSTEELMTVPAVLQHELIRDLKRNQSEAERRVAELAKRYGPKHPRMIAAQSDLESANNDLEREVRKVVKGINREYEVALRTERELQATWESSKSELQRFNRIEFRLQELQRDVDTNRQLYDVFLTRIKSISETGNFEKPHARIVDSATVPTRAERPKKRRILLVTFLLALVAGCVIAILLDILDNAIKRQEDVQEKLGAVLLGVVPRVKTDAQGRFPQFWQEPAGNFAESIRTVRTGLLLSDLDAPPKVVLVTSTVPAEGKSVFSLNLAAALGQMERTLVIGADLRRPSLAAECGLAAGHKGLSHFVSGSAELEDCIEYLDELKVHVMPAGLIPPNPLEMISSQKFVAALRQLRESFDRIVIDSAPVQAVSDAKVLASYADYVIYMVKADSTSATQARKGMADLRAATDVHVAVVLNQLRKSSADRYSYYHGDAYYGENTGS